MMEQTERHKLKHVKPHASSWTNGYQTRPREIPESAWKYAQRNPLTVSTNRAHRLTKHHACTGALHPKYPEALMQGAELSERYSHDRTRAGKERSLAGNVTVARNGRYKDEADDESPKYAEDELGNFTEDNEEEDADEEVEDEEEEEGADDPEKDYEEQEADDEVDDDAEISPQLQRMQRRVKNEALLRAQRMRDAEREQDLRRLRYQSHPSKFYEERALSKRYYQQHRGESDAAEPASEEEPIDGAATLKSAVRRPSMTGRHQASRGWPPTRLAARNDATRYEPTTATRRVRAWPEARQQHAPEPRATTAAAKRCSRCGGSDRKNTAARKAICRLQNRRDFPTKGPVGDEIECEEDALCGRCNLHHVSEKIAGPCEFSRSGFYAVDPRTCRDRRASRSSAYETPEEGRVGEEPVPKDYTTAKTRVHCRETVPAALYRQRTKHSVLSSRDRTRTPSEYRV